MISTAPREPAVEVPACLISRARSEYLEVPGLRLTPWQAARLWGVESGMSERVLVTLVDCGFLWRNHDGAYMRRSAR